MKRAICLMTVLPAAILVGCGGGGDSTPETPIAPTVQTPSKLSKADFIKEADGYCAELNVALGVASSGTTTDSSATGIEPVADLYNGLLQHLRGLGTPDDPAGLDEFYSAGDELVSAEESIETAQSDGDDAALASAQSESASAQSRFSTAASSYGFQECGQGGTTPSTTSTPATTVPATPAAPVTTTPTAPATPPGTTGAGGGTAGTGTGTGGGSTGTGGTTGGSGGVGPG